MATDTGRNPQERTSHEWDRLERSERALWRNSFLLVVFFGVAFAAASWNSLSASHWEILPVGVVIFVAIFSVVAWRKRRELDEWRGLLRGLHQAGSHPPTEAQIGKLLEIISRSQRGYRDLIDTLDHAVFTLSPEGVLRVANLYVAQVFAVPFQELIGHRLDAFFTDPSPGQSQAALARLLESGGWVGRIPVRLKRNAELRYFDCRFHVLRTEGQVVGISGWAHDVTAQHQSEIRFAELFDSLREGIFFTTPEGRVLDANPALVRMLGYAGKEELQARNFREVYVNPAQRDEMVRDLSDRGAVQDRELALRRKDGSPLRVLASGVAVRDMFGRIVHLQGTFVDITERVEMEKRLHQEQELFRRLVAGFPDMIGVLDVEGRFTYVSQRALDVIGEPPESYIGRSLGARMHPDDRPKVLRTFQDLVAGRAAHAQMEFRSQHVDGGWRVLRASARPLFDAAGKISGVVATARDVTEAKAADQQLLQNERLAAMGQMMAGVAHELNNPLTAILGVSDLLRERAADPAARRHVEIVLEQARRAAAIVQNLLAFSRPSAHGRVKLRLDEIVQQALEQHKTSLRQKNIAVEFSSPAGLPAIDGDPKLLPQVFSNLIVNAEQAIAGARERGVLRVALSRADNKVCAAFSDDGPGISSEHIGKLFDPFFTTKRPGGGAGLGLTICLALVKEHGGSIEVQSIQGRGATFRVTLPVPDVRPESAPADRAAPAASLATSPEASVLRGRSLLVVDDEDSIREIVQEGLAARGMKVEGAASAEDALAHLATASYEVILCDFNLPGLNGDQLFEKLRAGAGSSAPRFVFMTGALLDPAVIEGFSLKGASLLQKPFHVSGLAKLLAELLQLQPAKA